eukprot:125035_1
MVIISNELITELKTKCEVIEGNKLPIVGLCYHCCSDKNNNIVKIPPASFPTQFRNRYQHKCDGITRSIHNGTSCNHCRGGVNKCGFYIARKKETFDGYVRRVYKEYFVGEIEESKDDSAHIVDVGYLFFSEQDKILVDERRKILQKVGSYDWHPTLSENHRHHIFRAEKYLAIKYRQNRELYCYHMCYLLNECEILSVFQNIINIKDLDDILMDDLKKK